MPKRETKTRRKSAPIKTISKKNDSLRVRKATKKQIKKKLKKDVKSQKPIIGSFRLTFQSLAFIKKHWKPLIKIVLVYTIINLIFASGILSNASSVVREFNSKNLSDALNSYSTILSGGGADQATAAQTILLVIESLVLIWAIRHLFAKEKIGVKQAYYHSSGPLIPFMIVVFFIFLQLLPITLSSAVLAIVLSSMIGNAAAEVGFTLLFVLASFWSLYMITSSVFALYIVTLPNMHPRAALRTAKNLVRFRRWQVVRRVLFLPFFLFIVMGLVIVPLILYAKFLVSPVFFILCMGAVLYAHTYLYTLYKGLLE